MVYGGRQVRWQWDTPDGKRGAVTINGVRYDPVGGGTVFLVSTLGGPARVTQLKRDLSRLEPQTESFKALAKNDPDVARFLGEIPKPEGNP